MLHNLGIFSIKLVRLKVFLLFGLMVAAFMQCNMSSNSDQRFVLHGHTNGVQDSTLLYLSSNNINVDSTFIVDNKFLLQGSLTEGAEQFVLIRKDTPDYKFVWLEPGEMVLNASNSSLQEGVLKGSNTQHLADSLNELLEEAGYGLKRIRLQQKFIFDHPESVISAKALAVYATTWGKETTEELFARLSDELKVSKDGQKIRRYLALVKAPRVGEKYADFSMADTTDNVLKFSEQLSDLTLLEFWASWCGPCRVENPRLVKTYRKYKDEGFNVFAVSLDDNAASWKKAIVADSLPWQQVSDLKGDQNTAALIYGISGIPDNFLIDHHGTIIGRNLRGDDLEQQIASYFANKPNY